MKELILKKIKNIEMEGVIKIFVYQIKNKNGKLEDDVKKGMVENTVEIIEKIENIDTIVTVIDNTGIEGLNQQLPLEIVSKYFNETEAKL